MKLLLQNDLLSKPKLTFVAMFLSIIVIMALPGDAQLPEKFENLQILPSDISENDLMDVMNGFTRALGFKCNRCHVRSVARVYDYASDSLELKSNARYMMKMTKTINETHVANMDNSGEQKVEVRCYTCHRGKSKPYLINDVLMASHKEGGVDSLLVQFTALRDKYFGRDVYDLSHRALTDAAIILQHNKLYDDALSLLIHNRELYPKSDWILLITSNIYRDIGDTANAIIAMQAAADLRPKSRWYKSLLAELKGEKPEEADSK